jgi:hypothetical protein
MAVTLEVPLNLPLAVASSDSFPVLKAEGLGICGEVHAGPELCHSQDSNTMRLMVVARDL